MTSEDIKNVTFEKTMRGYRKEDVDDFLQQVANTIEDLEAELAEARSVPKGPDSETEAKMMLLAQKVEEYHGQEDTLKTALINAQRMGETIVHEAKQKADAMLREATGQTELLRQQAEQEINREQRLLEKLQSEVKRFRSSILNMYTQHIESLSALDAPIEQVDTFMSDNDIERLVEQVDEVDESYTYADEEQDVEYQVEYQQTEYQVQQDFQYDPLQPANFEPVLEPLPQQYPPPASGNQFDGVQPKKKDDQHKEPPVEE